MVIGLGLFALAGCGGNDDSGAHSASSYATTTTTASAAGALTAACDALLVEGEFVLTTANCAGTSRVTFGSEAREVTRWTVTRGAAVGDLDFVPSSAKPFAIVPPRVGCGYEVLGQQACIDAIASGAILRGHGACGAPDGAPLLNARGELVGLAIHGDDCTETRFISAFEAALF
jgi:hypothetical protein